MLTEKKKRKRKMWSKKYLERNVSKRCSPLFYTSWKMSAFTDYAIVVSAGKLKKLWDFLSELRNSVCERRLERTVLRPTMLPVKTAQFTRFIRQGEHYIAQFN